MVPTILIGNSVGGAAVEIANPVNCLEKQPSDIEPAEHLKEVV
jgi:hypothetical protein